MAPITLQRLVKKLDKLKPEAGTRQGSNRPTMAAGSPE